ncbi:MAG: hypothetical protein LC774_04670 [Acidobacteria bacterium]|nr:hypothetical protein [Acidobacteriota bacterium]
MRALLVTIGILLAAVGGAVAYRAAFGDVPSAFIVNEASGSVREVHNVWRVALGVLLLVAGAGLAFFAARRGRA